MKMNNSMHLSQSFHRSPISFLPLENLYCACTSRLWFFFIIAELLPGEVLHFVIHACCVLPHECRSPIVILSTALTVRCLAIWRQAWLLSVSRMFPVAIDVLCATTLHNYGSVLAGLHLDWISSSRHANSAILLAEHRMLNSASLQLSIQWHEKVYNRKAYLILLMSAYKLILQFKACLVLNNTHDTSI